MALLSNIVISKRGRRLGKFFKELGLFQFLSGLEGDLNVSRG